MNVEIHKENYQAYKERKSILDNQQLILHKLNNTGGDALHPLRLLPILSGIPPAMIGVMMERCLQGPLVLPPPPPADDED